MRKTQIAVTGLLVLLASWIAYAGSYSTYLTTTDVEKLTNLRGITLKEEANVLHFYRKDGKEILSIKFADKAEFKKYSDKSKYRALLPSICRESVSGVPQMPYIVVFLTKKETVIVSTFHKVRVETILPFHQVLAVARLLGSRMQPS